MSQQEIKFAEVKVSIPFFKINEDNFTGYLLKKEEREDESKIILCEDLDGKRYYLGGFSIIQFYDNFYIQDKVCKISFIEKTQTSNGRSVNSFKFEIEE